MRTSDGTPGAAQARLRVVRVLPVLDFGGVESRVALQAKLRNRSRFDLRVCAFHGAGAAARAIEATGVPVDVLNVDPSIRSLRPTFALARYLRRVQPDILHASIAEANLHGVLAGRLARVPVLIAEEVGTPAHGALARLAFRTVYGAADGAIGVTQATCEYMLRVDGAPRDRVHCIYNCAGVEHFPDARPPPRDGRKAGTPFCVVLVGRLVPVKNHATFLRAVAHVALELDMVVQIVGEGPLKDATLELVRHLDLESRVSLLGFRTDVRGLLQGADIFALPSLSEGCSVSLVEAMAAGVPIVASRVPGVIEVMGKELSAEWTVAPNDVAGWANTLRRMHSLTPPQRAELGRRAQAIAYERFSPSVYLRNLEALYDRLWERKNAGVNRQRATSRS